MQLFGFINIQEYSHDLQQGMAASAITLLFYYFSVITVL